MFVNSVALLLITCDTFYSQIKVSVVAVLFLENFLLYSFKSIKTIAMNSTVIVILTAI